MGSTLMGELPAFLETDGEKGTSMTKELLKALEDSDVVGASRYLNENLTESNRAWEIHLSLFPLFQRVLNPKVNILDICNINEQYHLLMI
jgi:hypothetical protein